MWCLIFMQPCTFNWDTHKIWVQRITFNHNSSLVPVSLQPYTRLHKSHQNSHFNHNRHKNYFFGCPLESFVASSLEYFSLVLSEMINWRCVFLSCLCPANDGSFELQGCEHCFSHWEGERWFDAVSDACPGASSKALLYYYASVPQENMLDELLLPLTPY